MIIQSQKKQFFRINSIEQMNINMPEENASISGGKKNANIQNVSYCPQDLFTPKKCNFIKQKYLFYSSVSPFRLCKTNDALRYPATCLPTRGSKIRIAQDTTLYCQPPLMIYF